MKNEPKQFLAGVIEGFYGQPWSQAERFQLFNWMSAWGLNTYLYAPKDDLKHRALWRELYSTAEADILRQLVDACRQLNLHFIYALSPGLDIRFSDETERVRLKKRFEQMVALGCRDFALLFDDIPDRMDAEDQKRFGTFASAQCHLTNALFKWVRDQSPDARFLFCPTPYCGRMRAAQLGGLDYLPTIGRELLPEIDIFWTGPEIISREISVADIQELGSILRRKPVIWDNLHANDYDGRRFFCGPYTGRPLELRAEVNGILANPNNEFPLNYIPLRTLAEFIRCSADWNPRKAYLSALREWLPHFATVGQPIAEEELIPFLDCYYLPHEEGPEAVALCDRARDLLAKNSASWGDEAAAFQQHAARLRGTCARFTELRDRPLFYALSRRIWDLREELDLLDRYIGAKRAPSPAAIPPLIFHLPGTCRGGFVAQLQRLLVQQPDGTFLPNE
jgi:protein O-GlcNAcase/histone acetyltransferase